MGYLDYENGKYPAAANTEHSYLQLHAWSNTRSSPKVFEPFYMDDHYTVVMTRCLLLLVFFLQNSKVKLCSYTFRNLYLIGFIC